MVWTDADYLQDPFPPDGGADLRRASIRTAKKEHTCWGLNGAMDHKIMPGDRYRHEKALVDGEWGEYRLCLGCMGKWLEEWAQFPAAAPGEE